MEAEIAAMEQELSPSTHRSPPQSQVGGATKRATKHSEKLEKLKNPKKKKKIEMTDDEIEENARMLCDKMRDAVNEDNRANAEKRPALCKLMLLDKVTRDLRKIAVQEKFLDLGGLQWLGRWL